MTAPIEDIYPLSPMQTGMLFHTLSAQGSGLYVEQLVFTFEGCLELEPLERAWRKVAERHTVLRTCFVWEGVDEPMQVVQRSVTIPFERHDWRGHNAAEQERRLSAFLRADRRRGFDLSSAPLMRLASVHLGDDRHTIMWSHHHMLLDGWSVPLVLEEVFACYNAFRQGRHPVVPAARPYRDYVAWLLRQDMAPARAFWRQALDGFTGPTPLAVDRRTGIDPVPEYSGAETTLSEETTAALRSSARALKVTLNTLAQGVWGLLLSRYSDAADVVFGAIVAGRPATLPGVEEMVGMFINTLPVRVRVPVDAVVGPWLQSLQREQVKAREFEHAPLAEVQRYAGLPSDRQLFESVLAFENYPTTEPRPPAGRLQADTEPPVVTPPRALRVSGVKSFTKTNYPLNIVIVDGARLRIKIVYDEQRFETDAIDRMLQHLTALMIEMAAHPDGLVTSLQMLPEAERRQVLSDWNRTDQPFPAGATIPELFEAQAARTPDRLAVAAGAHQVSYAELNARANRLAHGLRDLGVGPDVPVAICLRRSVEQVTGVLAILKAGGAYVPLDPDQPPARLRTMLLESGARIALTDPDTRDRLPALPSTIDVRRLGVDWPDGGWPDGDPVRHLTADHLAYVIFTSGSTGRPNGVAVSHRSVINLLTWHQRVYDVTAGDRATQLAAPGFDAAVWELWPYLAAGASVHIPDEGVLVSPRLLRNWIADERITLSFVPTPLAELVVHLGDAWPPHLALRALLTGGDVLRRPPRQPLPFRLVNHYGPTECAVVATAGPVDTASAAGGRPSIGRPIANTKLYVLDRHLQPVPVLVPGELCIGGAGLARGYLNNPALTMEKFVADPYGGVAGGRLYRSGDVGRFLPNGDVEFLGRLDSQVKVRGVRIEPGDVERAIARHPSIQSVVVATQQDPSGDPHLVAYCVASGPAPTDAELRQVVREHLPASMVPAAFVHMDALPLTRNGKVDRQSLPAAAVRAAAPRGDAAPHDELERTIARGWQEVLRVDAVGVTDNFFDVGGHSLLVFRLHNKLCDLLGRELSLMDLFAYPTVRSLADFLRDGRHDQASKEGLASRAASQRQAFAARSRMAAVRKLGDG